MVDKPRPLRWYDRSFTLSAITDTERSLVALDVKLLVDQGSTFSL